MLKAVIFDSDGTLVNSFELIVSAYAHVAGVHGLKAPTPAEVRAQLGKALPDIFRTFYPDQDANRLVATNSAFFGKHVHKVTAFEGLHGLLDELQQLGIQMAVVTGGNHKIHDVLVHNNIDKHFASVVHCERTARPKPDPEGVLLALHELGVDAKEAVLVGDTGNDIVAGKKAGVMKAIGITHGYGSAQELEAAEADLVVGSLIELSALLKQLHTVT